MKNLFYNICFGACLIALTICIFFISPSVYKDDAQTSKQTEKTSNAPVVVQCRACQFDHPPQIYLLAVNTGNLYSLARDFSPSPGSLSISGAYDDLSKTSLNIVNDGKQDYIMAYLRQGRDMVSLKRMKTIYCDDCLDKILSTIDGQTITSFVLFSASDETFSPISDGLQMQGEDYALNVNYDVNNNKMQIEYNPI